MKAQAEDGSAVPVCVECIREHVERLTRIRHPNTCPVGLAKAADYIRKQLCKSGATVSDLPFKVKGFAGEFCNVEGVINANEEQEEWIVSAHYDTVCNSPGADDNASGVAVMLEAARVIGFKSSALPAGPGLGPIQEARRRPGSDVR